MRSGWTTAPPPLSGTQKQIALGPLPRRSADPAGGAALDKEGAIASGMKIPHRVVLWSEFPAADQLDPTCPTNSLSGSRPRPLIARLPPSAKATMKLITTG
ncbi:hypothetical protein GGTG_09075 [Gaeumannomyces tritici R3-111a-1]|uniref:Uncharacterized protein n=1 Tax=Gaeumannomyces tritici (strain R3-111a-1) TaxID=644352 RepID=J3P6D4_GAET3|nr:hypothetical protein GGTG_09075 [Gaeumannomyces tritici R3-111a-1]EJT72208.1 hypothetical protein GGTG_09075 [Gaeumannomyces tritici R3-111a-1]